MECIIAYETWQMECCGEAFAIGDMVTWCVKKTNDEPIAMAEEIGAINYYYEAHSSDWKNLSILEGKVKNIKVLYRKYQPITFKTLDVKLVDIKFTKRFEKEIPEMKSTEYIITLNDCSVRPATKKDFPWLNN